MRELELYVHIPFCIRKCAYCDFLSGPADEAVREQYVDALVREIRSYRKWFADYRVSTIFTGGGTPSILSPGQIQDIFAALRENFTVDTGAEITIEANPGTVTEEKIRAWKAAGVNRVSIGLQSAKDEELRMLGRIHDYRQFLDTWEMVRGAGIDNANIDLIFAIPGQTPKSWEETLRKTAELSPEHLSVYSLIIEEGTPFYDMYGEASECMRSGNGEEEKEATADQREHEGESWAHVYKPPAGVRIPRLPDEETERRMYEDTAAILQEYGYSRYEISNYAKPGCECRHNMGYWQRKEYLGIGLGASSLIRNTRFCRSFDLTGYLSGAGPAENFWEEREELTVKDEMEEFMFLGLRMMRGVSKSEFLRLFGIPMDQVYGEPLYKMEKNGLLEITEDRVRLTESGIHISNYVFAQFLF